MQLKEKTIAFYNAMFAHDDYEVHRYDVGSFCTRHEIIKMIKHPSGSVLEIGTGISTLLEDLSIFKRSGIDLSPESVSKVQAVFAQKKIVADIRVADATDLPFEDASFDVIVTSHLLEHVENDLQCIKECARVLKPGGELIIWVPGRVNGLATTQEWERNGHYRMYNKERFMRLEQAIAPNLYITALSYPHKIHNLLWNHAKNLFRWINYPIKKFIMRDNKSYETRPFYRNFLLPVCAKLLNKADKLTRKSEKNFLGVEFNVLVRFEKK